MAYHIENDKKLRASVRKNQTNSKIPGNSQKIDFAHTLKLDTLSYEINPCAISFAKFFLFREKFE